MGSDRHPRPEIEGALLAARHYGVRVLLVGPEDRLRRELSVHPTARNLPIDVVNATQVIEMEEGNRLHAPIYGPAAGALLEAYRAAGIHPKLA